MSRESALSAIVDYDGGAKLDHLKSCGDVLMHEADGRR